MRNPLINLKIYQTTILL